MLLYKYTEVELQEIIKTMVILVDTREQKNQHILKWLDSKEIKYKKQKLDFADYSCMIPKNITLGIDRDMYFNNIVSIERKAHLDELSQNLGRYREQFKNEMLRSKGRVHLLLENSTYEMAVKGEYKSEFKPKNFIGSLMTFQTRYNLSITYLEHNRASGSWIYNTLSYAVREYLKN